MIADAWGKGLPFAGRAGELDALERALRRSDCRAAVISGPPGVGRSRLADEFLARAGGRGGHRTVRVQATHTARPLPLSALAPLLPSSAYVEDTARFLHEVRRGMAAHRAGTGARTVLVVDDVHHLDDTSLALLCLLLGDNTVFLTATLPDGADWPDVLRSLWRQDRLRHVPLSALGEGDSGQLLRAAVGGPIAAPALRAVWETGQGNPLCMREVLRTALAEDRLVRVHGVWCLARPLAPVAPAVSHDERLGSLPPAQHTLLELLAVAGPIGLRDALAHVTAAGLAELEERRLIVARVEGRRERVALAHPLDAQFLRAGITRLRARELLLDQAARVRRHGARRAEDVLSLARWELDATGTADPSLLVRAAALALNADDVDTMCRLARAALLHGPHAQAGLMLGEALGQRGEFTEGIAVLESAFEAARGPEIDAAALALAVNLFYGPGDLGRALAVLDEAARRRGPSPALAAWQATLLTAAGRTAQAHGVLGSWPAQDSARPTPGGVLLLQARLRVELGQARAEDAIRTGHAVYAAHTALAERTAVYYPARSLYLLAAAQLEAGRIDEADRTAREGLDALLRSPVPALVVWFGWVRGRIALDAGRVADAAAHFREARAQAHLYGHRFAEQRALAGLVLADACAGRVGPASADLAAVAADPATPLRQADTVRAHAWALHCQGHHRAAADTLRTGVEQALSAGEPAAATVLQHDLLRWGAEDAADLLVTLADRGQGAFAAARAAHARALALRDGRALTAAADQWAGLGALLLAAETLAQAARAFAASGTPAGDSAAKQATVRALALKQRCPGAATPPLAALSPAADLSLREREIALLAAGGHTSKQIAAQCGLSVRTVDNTLGRAYRKLGINDRSGLRRVLTHS